MNRVVEIEGVFYAVNKSTMQVKCGPRVVRAGTAEYIAVIKAMAFN